MNDSLGPMTQPYERYRLQSVYQIGHHKRSRQKVSLVKYFGGTMVFVWVLNCNGGNGFCQ